MAIKDLSKAGRRIIQVCGLIAMSAACQQIRAASIQFEGVSFRFANAGTDLTHSIADGSAGVTNGGSVLTIIGPNNGSGFAGTSSLTATAAVAGTVAFDWSYASLDDPTYDTGGYLLGNTFVELADTDGESGVMQFAVSAGEQFGFRVTSVDNQNEPGILSISSFDLTGAGGSAVPEPGAAWLLLLGSAACVAGWRRLGARNV